jgi:hypothetical protein
MENALSRSSSRSRTLRGLACVLAAVLLASSATVAGAQAKSTTHGAPKLYKWEDENGIVHYGDHVPAEYSNRERQVLNAQGVPIKTLQKEMTPQEMATELKRIEEESQRSKAAEQATQRDHILLLSYLNVHEIEMLRDQRIATLDGQVKVNEHYVGVLRSKLNELEKKAHDYNYPFDPASSKPQLPDELAQDLLLTVNQLNRRESEMQRIRAEQIEIRAQFDADIERFKELKPDADTADAAASQARP